MSDATTTHEPKDADIMVSDQPCWSSLVGTNVFSGPHRAQQPSAVLNPGSARVEPLFLKTEIHLQSSMDDPAVIGDLLETQEEINSHPAEALNDIDDFPIYVCLYHRKPCSFMTLDFQEFAANRH